MNKRNYIKRLVAILCTFSLIPAPMGSFVKAEETVKFNYKLGMDSDSLFDAMYGYSGGTSETPAQPNLSKSYVEGKYGKALQITYHGFKINNAAKRYNAYLFKFKQSDITVGSETMKMLDLMRDTNTISMYVHTPQTVDHTGSGAAENRTLEMIFEFATTAGNKKYSKKFQLPNTGEWAYINLPMTVFNGNGTNMKDGIQDESYTSLTSMSISFPYKDYFGANPDDATWETPWDEPLIIDEMLFDRSTDTEEAVNPPSSGEEAYHENANIKALYVDGYEVTGFNKDSEVNEVALPGYITPEEISAHFTVEPEATDIKKTNTNQAVTGAKYVLSLPSALPGQGSITVTSASGKAKKTYKINFTLREGVRVLKDKISGDGTSSLTVPIINESASNSTDAAVIVGITDKESGALIRACTAGQKTIAAGESVDFSVETNIKENESAQIFIVNSLSELKLIAAPFTLPYTETGTAEYSGELSGVSVQFSEESNTLSVSASAKNGGGLIVVKDAEKIIGAKPALVKDGKINENILIGDDNSGEMSVAVIFGDSRVERNFYNATEAEMNDCVRDYKALTQTDALSFYEKYGKILSIPAELWNRLSQSDKISALVNAEKNVTKVEEIRSAVNSEVVLNLVNNCDAQLIEKLFKDYNDILGFDTNRDFYNEYVRENVSKVIEAVAKNKYESLEAANKAFLDSGLIYAINNVSNYAEIGNLIEENISQIGASFNFAQYNALSSAEKTGFLSYMSKKHITSFSDLNKALSEYEKTESSAPGVSGKGESSGGTIIPSDTTNSQAQSENSLPAQKTVFEDVPATHWAYGSVQALYILKIADGVSEGFFGAESPVTREQFVKLLTGAATINTEENAPNRFTDVDEKQWYAPYISTAAQSGIVTGITDTEFGIGQNVTREDMAVLIARALEAKGVSLPQFSGEKFGDDSDISDYAKRSVYSLKEMGLISGMEDNLYKPKDSATRAQSAKLLYGVYAYITGTAKEEIEEYSALYKKLSAIGLLNIKKNAQDIVSRGEFAKIMSAFMNRTDNSFSTGEVMYADVPEESIYYHDVMFLYGKSIISGNTGLFRPDDPITVSDALSMTVKALGYGELMKIEGITDYYSAAVRYKIIEDNYGMTDGPMSFETVMKLIDHIKDVEVVKVDLSGASPSYAVTGETALYYYHDILTVKEILRSAGIRAVDAGFKANNDTVGIGSELYTCSDSEVYKYLGCQVKGYYDEDDEVLVYAEPTERNSIIKVYSEQIDYFGDSTLYYWEGSSKRKAQIPKSARLMRNYNYAEKLSDGDYENAEEIILIDNNGDGEYEAVNVIDEKTYFVSQISFDTGTIYDYYENTPIITEDDAVFNVYDINGTILSVSDISINDVLSVQSDAGNESHVIYVSRQRDEGVVKATGTEGTEKYALVGDNKYNIADNVKDEPSAVNKLTVGNGVTVCLNHRNKIAHVIYNHKFSDFNYGYVIRAAASDSGDDVIVRMYTDSGDLESLTLASKAVVNGSRITTAEAFEETLKSANIDTSSVSQLVKFKKNSDGKIRELNTADYVDDIDLYTSASDFTRYHDLTDSYYHVLYKAYVGYVRMAEDTIIINVPADKSDENNKNAYGITPFSELYSGTHKRVEVYNMSQDKTAGVAVIHSGAAGGSELNSNSTAMVIKSVGEIFVDGEIRKKLTVLYNGEEREYVMAEDCPLTREYVNNGKTAVSILDKGDVIRAGINGNNEICDYHKIFDLSNDDDPNVVSRGFEKDGAAEYYGSKRNLIAYSGNAENGNDDVRCGRLWEGNNNSAWFPGVRCSFEFGYAKEVHNNTVILGVYPGSDADNKGNADRYLNLKNRRVYIIDEVNDEIKLGTPEDIVSAQYADEAGASRIIAERHSDVASCIIIVKRR